MSIDDLVSVKCQKRSVHQTAPPKGSWVQKCKRVWKAKPTSHGVSVKCPCPQCNRPPRQKAVESKNAKEFEKPELPLVVDPIEYIALESRRNIAQRWQHQTDWILKSISVLPQWRDPTLIEASPKSTRSRSGQQQLTWQKINPLQAPLIC